MTNLQTGDGVSLNVFERDTDTGGTIPASPEKEEERMDGEKRTGPRSIGWKGTGDPTDVSPNGEEKSLDRELRFNRKS